jgi:hypothetical protein
MNNSNLHILNPAYRYRYRSREDEKKIARQLSPLEYQWHAERTGRLSVKSQWGYGHHLRRSQTLVERRYPGITFSEGLASIFRLLLDLDFISRNEHRQDGYAFSLEKPEYIV